MHPTIAPQYTEADAEALRLDMGRQQAEADIRAAFRLGFAGMPARVPVAVKLWGPMRPGGTTPEVYARQGVPFHEVFDDAMDLQAHARLLQRSIGAHLAGNALMSSGLIDALYTAIVESHVAHHAPLLAPLYC